VTFRRAVWLECDLCGRKGPTRQGDFEATRGARAKGWRTPPFDRYGNVGHVCPRCVAGRSDDQLITAILTQAPDQAL
jgi:hypothetical protein